MRRFDDRSVLVTGGAQGMGRVMVERFVEEGACVVIVYNAFESALVQRVVEREVLPIPESALEGGEEEEREQAAMRGGSAR